jgi:hypothetical protein
LGAGADEVVYLEVAHPAGGVLSRMKDPSDDYQLSLRGFVFLLILTDGFTESYFFGRLWLFASCEFSGDYECSTP